MRKLLLATTVIAAAAVASEASYATTIYTLSQYEILPDNGINVTLQSSITGAANGYFGSGELYLYNNSFPTAGLDVFCTDITDDLFKSPKDSLWTTTPLGPNPDAPSLTTTQEEEIGWLINNYDINAAPANFTGDPGHFSAAQEYSSATQIAIWTDEYATNPLDGGIGDATFNFTSDDPNLNKTGGLVDELVHDANSGYGTLGLDPTELAPWDAGTSSINWSLNQAQSFLTTGQLNNGECVTDCPEPASMALLGSGLLAIGWVRRKRRT